MRIRVQSYAYMRKHTAHLANGGELEVPHGSTVEEVLQSLGVPADTGKIVLVDGRACSGQRVLQDGDFLVFYPLLEGG